MNQSRTPRPTADAYPTGTLTGSPADTSPDRPTGVETEQGDNEPGARTQLAGARLLVESHRFCPGCGTEMIDRGCKLRCTRCGFFLDCSDG